MPWCRMQVTLGLRPTEHLLWSFQTLLAAQSEQRLVAPSNVGMAVTGNEVAILIQDQLRDGSQQAFIHR